MVYVVDPAPTNWKTTGLFDDNSDEESIDTVPPDGQIDNMKAKLVTPTVEIEVLNPDPDFKSVERMKGDPDGDLSFVQDENGMVKIDAPGMISSELIIKEEPESQDEFENEKNSIQLIPDDIDEKIEEAIDRGFADFDFYSEI